jgi:hypothetical protein
VNVDGRLAKINKEVFLETIINMATDEGMLLQMHQTFENKCAVEEEEQKDGQPGQSD